MPVFKLRYISLFAFFMLASCVSIEEICTTGDWETYGFEDGARGDNKSQFNYYKQQCAKFDITPNAKLWNRGYQDGLATYCTPRRAYEIGRYRDTPLNNVCPAKDRLLLDLSNQFGQQLHELDGKITRLRIKSRKLKEQISELPKDSVDRALLIAQRISIDSDILDIRQRLFRLERRFEINLNEGGI